jgi:CRP-like cAMP-binding protein
LVVEKDVTFLSTLVTKLETLMYVPENVIVQQNTKGDGVYFIQTGDCVVNIKSQNGKDRIAHRLLSEGDHFGEISTIYGCEV